ncbi:uncharacterized protein LOC112569674 isoform X1 [Pomacea canaliculata]|uniref:uncharacterized protein LOC112569674 isoform X1 n=1 Tax=Pomacea canaliculata TaxID=400727 RepID=UPI000D73C600|nr:uncharacterized protein LOC112569674 isoform X1 [Pomacea canaliculata]
MKTSAKVLCIFVHLLALTTGVLLSTCGESNFNETLRKEEYDFVNISYTINATRSSNSLGIFHIAYEVCEKNLKKLSCSLRWENSLNSMDRKYMSRTTGVNCYGEERNLSSSEVALNLHISQVVTRSLSVMILSSSAGRTSRPRRLIRVDVLYPSNITSMTVDGHEVKDNYVIYEGHKVDISCAFETGNPPVIFQLLNQHNSVLKSSDNQGHLNYSLTARCEDEWPIISCQGSGSTRNRSLTFLVACPPQFVDSSVKFVSKQIFQEIKFRVKAHTAALTGCVLTPVALGNNIRRGVSCFLSGNPPDLVLSVYLHKETNISQGNWSLILHNDKGSANTTLCIIDSPSSSKYNYLRLGNSQIRIFTPKCIINLA